MKHSVKKKEWFWAYVFITPMVLGTLIFGIFPIIYSFKISLTKWDGIGESVYVGVQNFVNLLSNEKFKFEVKNTFVYTIFYVPVSLVLSVIVAELLNQKIRGKGVFRVIYFLPNIVMPAAAAMIWRFMLNSKYGIINIVLDFFHLPTPIWVADPKFIMAAVILVSVWSAIGYNAIILLAGLQGISRDIYEAAKIDGSGAFSTFIKITVPLVSPTLFFLLTMGVMNGLKAFDIIFMFVQNNAAGPLQDATRTMVYGIYESAFRYMRMGDASAEAIVLFVVIILVTAVQFKLQDKWVHYE